MKEVKASFTTDNSLKGLHIYMPTKEEFERALFKAWDLGIPRVWLHKEGSKWVKSKIVR